MKLRYSLACTVMMLYFMRCLRLVSCGVKISTMTSDVSTIFLGLIRGKLYVLL